MDTVKGYSFSTPMVAGLDFAVNGPPDKRLDWDAIDWRFHEANVVRLRRRIFKATREHGYPTRNALAACLSRGAGKARSPGSEGAPAWQRAGATRPDRNQGTTASSSVRWNQTRACLPRPVACPNATQCQTRVWPNLTNGFGHRWVWGRLAQIMIVNFPTLGSTTSRGS